MNLTEKEQQRLEYAKESIHVTKDNVIHQDSYIHSSSRGSIGCDGFGFARDIDGGLVKMNHSGNVIIDKNVVIREFVTIDRAVNGSTIIGEGSCIDHHCHIAHGVKIGKYNTLAAHCVIEGSCEVGNFNTFGAGVIVQRKVSIGSGNIFGSGSVVTKDVGDNLVLVGNPARIIKQNV